MISLRKVPNVGSGKIKRVWNYGGFEPQVENVNHVTRFFRFGFEIFHENLSGSIICGDKGQVVRPKKDKSIVTHDKNFTLHDLGKPNFLDQGKLCEVH